MNDDYNMNQEKLGAEQAQGDPNDLLNKGEEVTKEGKRYSRIGKGEKGDYLA